jgi:hypothetical protein
MTVEVEVGLQGPQYRHEVIIYCAYLDASLLEITNHNFCSLWQSLYGTEQMLPQERAGSQGVVYHERVTRSDIHRIQ